MLRRSIIVVVPGAALAVVGIAVVGPGALRPFDGVRLWGGPTEGARGLSFRIEVVQRFQGIDSPHDIGEIEVQATTPGGLAGAFRGRTRSDGIVDAQIPLSAQARGTVAVVVRAGGGPPLVAGTISRGVEGWGHGTGPIVSGRRDGDLAITVAAARGVFATPFRDELVVQVQRLDRPVPGASVKVEASGASIELSPGSRQDGAVSVTTGPRGAVVVGVVPTSHDVEISIEATALGLSGTWHGNAPVTPGAMWLDPASIRDGRLRIVSPVPRATAYATIATRTERLWGGSIALLADRAGFWSGEIARPAVGDAQTPAWLTIAGDPRGTGSGTTGWTLRPTVAQSLEDAVEERRFPDVLLLDGMPQAETREISRRSRARQLGMAALFAAAVLEVLLLADTARSAERKMRDIQAAFADAVDTAASRASARESARRALFWFVVSAAVVAMAFAAVGVVLLWKTGG